MYCKALKHDTLVEVGITKVERIGDEWIIHRHWYDNSSKVKSTKIIKITEATRRHKYRPDKVYPKVNFTARGYGTFSVPLSRFIYAWFIGDIPEGYVVDHMDNDPYNNDPYNLQLLTIGENLAKRFNDNPAAWTNQWGKQKGYKKGE